ncbi:MAG: hypothetical protein ACRDQ4_06490 [Pseudonocardiaceae bacterium]
MYTEPDDRDVTTRMRTAHRWACVALSVQPEPHTHEAWGWRGRTLSQPVTTPDGPAWLRLASAPTGQVDATFWNGSIEAEKAIPGSLSRPRLRDSHDWNDTQWQYRAELYDRVTAQPVAAFPTLTATPILPVAWWTALRIALDTITEIPTDRYTIRQTYLDQSMPRFLGTPIDATVKSWSTAHGDFHFANICAPTLHILDWEGWGLAPTGYDAAMIHSYSLLVPHITARIRDEFADLLDTPSGRIAELAVITELLHANTRGDHLALAGPLRQRAELLLGRAIPA